VVHDPQHLVRVLAQLLGRRRGPHAGREPERQGRRNGRDQDLPRISLAKLSSHTPQRVYHSGCTTGWSVRARHSVPLSGTYERPGSARSSRFASRLISAMASSVSSDESARARGARGFLKAKTTPWNDHRRARLAAILFSAQSITVPASVMTSPASTTASGAIPTPTRRLARARRPREAVRRKPARVRIRIPALERPRTRSR